jgi:hypothetical protein
MPAMLNDVLCISVVAEVMARGFFQSTQTANCWALLRTELEMKDN